MFETKPDQEGSLSECKCVSGDNAHQPMEHFVQNTHSLSFYGGSIALKHFVLQALSDVSSANLWFPMSVKKFHMRGAVK